MAFDRTGALFAVSPIDAGSSSLLSVNPANAQAAQIAVVARSLSGLVVMPCPAPCLSFAGASPGWFRPTKLRSADFDLDGDDDLVLLAARDLALIRSSVTFLQSAGDGSFTVAVNHPLSSPPNTITGDELMVAQLNGDALPDVIARNVFTAPASIAVFLNSGAVNFPAPAYPATGIDPRSIDVGDLNGDAISDLVLVGDGVLLTYPGDGLGGFGTGLAPFAMDPEWFLLAVRLGDVDGDNDLDLVAMDSARLLVSLNEGTGGFAAPVTRVITYEDNGVEVADVNGDGWLDVVSVVVGQDGGFNVYLSQGNGQMGDPVFNSFAAGLSGNLPQDFVLGDLNDDDLPDLVFAEYIDAAVHLWLSQGDGTFKPHRKGPLPTMPGRPPLTVTIGDFNGDDQPDIAAGVLMLNQIWTWLSN
jgi:hypothetical protein